MPNLSPCKKICQLTNDGLFCKSCLRSLNEIKNWKHFSDKKKQKIMLLLKKRVLNHA